MLYDLNPYLLSCQLVERLPSVCCGFEPHSRQLISTKKKMECCCLFCFVVPQHTFIQHTSAYIHMQTAYYFSTMPTHSRLRAYTYARMHGSFPVTNDTCNEHLKSKLENNYARSSPAYLLYTHDKIIDYRAYVTGLETCKPCALWAPWRRGLLVTTICGRRHQTVGKEQFSPRRCSKMQVVSAEVNSRCKSVTMAQANVVLVSLPSIRWCCSGRQKLHKKCISKRRLSRILLVHEVGVAKYYLSMQNKKHEARF